MTTLADIEEIVSAYANKRKALKALINNYHDDISKLKDKHVDAIQAALKDVEQLNKSLTKTINRNRALFEKPKTRRANGIRFGVKKEKGKLIIEDEEKTIALIKKHCADSKQTLIATVEKPIKSALQQLSTAMVKRLGIKVEDDVDAVFIKSADSDIDKLIDAIADPNIKVKELL
tara:strand:+ start:682 stop:1206 length:525 start_codon:yes stop_codon:yes gene_type:complete